MKNKIKYMIFSYIFLISIVFACPRGTNCFIPAADAGEDKTYYINSTVTLDGSGSSDPEDAELTYLWTSEYFSDNLNGSNPSFSIGSVTGDIIISLMVNDGEAVKVISKFAFCCKWRMSFSMWLSMITLVA